MDEKFTKGTRVHVTNGPYAGRYGYVIRPDGTLHGRPVWLVKLDDSMFGAAVETRHMTPVQN